MNIITLSNIIERVGNALLIIVLSTVIITSGLYLWERGRPAEDYLTYYGNVTTKQVFRSPDEITSYAFGEFIGKEHGNITFINNLWCKPIGLDVSSDIIQTRLKQYDNYEFVNPMPNNGLLQSQAFRAFFSFGVADRESIRNNAINSGYESWSMGNIAPETDSTCYIAANIITYTTIFKLPKIITFTGNPFDYIVVPVAE